MDADPIFVDEGDLAAARELVDTVDDAELFLYPGKATWQLSTCGAMVCWRWF
jgi:hypothetical protein